VSFAIQDTQEKFTTCKVNSQNSELFCIILNYVFVNQDSIFSVVVVLLTGLSREHGSVPSRATPPDWLWDPSSLLYGGYWGLCPPGVMGLGHECNHPPPSSAEVKNARNCGV
jgi:hypothetical protein